ncbi:hypothetical protein BCR32DRAFT_270649 [Anaeromyces robustus]|uniref:RING-CH-type domain-containing protein n=1 Tax=Anaeromyces robustus TaxID=1754192 RepID=A0A1Y1WV74_9FUNG|nr:hypothetical protein BCR32DRAFT_270649 [Anaeromyces robustus]|eukprot:ORX77447.1 hypothetical protein BCR32DRAFT_270649 [Anaeromyces robustus]
MNLTTNDEKICRICLSNTLNLFDDDLLRKIINQSELIKKNDEKNDKKGNKDNLNLKNEDSNNNEKEKDDEIDHIKENIDDDHNCDNNGNNGHDHNQNLYNYLKNIDNTIIKKCIYDYYYEDNKNDLFKRTLRKNDSSLELPLRKTNSSFFNPFNDENKSNMNIEKERNILRSSYMKILYKNFHYKKNKLCFILNVQKNLQKNWWLNQNIIKRYQKKYLFLNRIPGDVSYYIDKLISPCQCKGSQKYVHSYCLDEWRMKISIEFGQQESCILCRQNYKKKDNQKWYTRLQRKDIQNIILYITIIGLIAIGGYIMKYILDVTYKYLDIGLEYDMFYENNNITYWSNNILSEFNITKENYFYQPPETENIVKNLYPEKVIYNISEVNENTSQYRVHDFLFSGFFLKSINMITDINYHIMAGIFFWGSVINTVILYDSIEMVVKHHFNRELRFKPLLVMIIIYFWWIYCSAAFEDIIEMNQYSISQKLETIFLLKDGWVAETIESLLFIAKWTLRIVTMELGIYFNGIYYLKELLTFNYSACLNKDQVLNYDEH